MWCPLGRVLRAWEGVGARGSGGQHQWICTSRIDKISKKFSIPGEQIFPNRALPERSSSRTGLFLERVSSRTELFPNGALPGTGLFPNGALPERSSSRTRLFPNGFFPERGSSWNGALPKRGSAIFVVVTSLIQNFKLT